MYEYIEGRITGRSAARLVVEAGGVGYELLVPIGAAFPTEGSVRAWAHLAVREDAHVLYGFPDRESRDLFRSLLSVRGVGPTMALGVLSGMSRAELVQALLDEDLGRLTHIKGVGKKTAEQILLDLRDKAPSLAGTAPPDSPLPSGKVRPGSGESNIEDAVAALMSVGYSPKEARRQVARASGQVDPGDLDLLVRTALQG